MSTTSGLKVSCVCGWTGTVAARLAGKLVRCPRCSAKLRVSTFVPAPEPAAVAWEETRIVEGEEREEPEGSDWMRMLRVIGRGIAWILAPFVSVCLVGVAWAAHTAEQDAWIHGHVAILCVPFVLTWWVGTWFNLRWNWYVVGGLAAIAIGADWWHASTATYVVKWERDIFQFTDTHYRGSERPHYRRFFDPRVGTEEGAFAPSAEGLKRHGPWEFRGLDVLHAIEWYWYGEKITEGEWHLRSKR